MGSRLQAQAAAQEGWGPGPAGPADGAGKGAETAHRGGYRGPSWGAWSGVQGCPARSCQCGRRRVWLAPRPLAQVPSQGCQPCSAGERVKKGEKASLHPEAQEREEAPGEAAVARPVSRHCYFSSRPAVRLRPGLAASEGKKGRGSEGHQINH